MLAALIGALCSCLLFQIGKGLASPLELTFSVPPHVFVAEQIGGKLVRATPLVNQGKDPHTFEPTPRQLIALSRTGNFFAAGLDFEQQLIQKILNSNQNLLIFDITEGIKPYLHKQEDGADHGGELDQHTWLSPDLLEIQATSIYKGIASLDSVNQTKYADNLAIFIKKLRNVKQEAGQILRPYAGKKFYVFHPAFGYLGRAFNLRQQAVEIGESIPSPRQFEYIISAARNDKIKTIFSQPQFDQRSAAVVARAIEGKVVVLDPMKKDVLNNYLEIARALKKSF